MIPSLTAPLGALPPGRYPTTIADFTSVFVNASTGVAQRQKLLDDWVKVTQVLQTITPVIHAWIGGSFLTDKDVPGDIDCLYWVEDTDLDRARLDADHARILQAIATSQMKSLGLQVDSYIGSWVSNPTVSSRSPTDDAYHQSRGYWDNLWSRQRSGANPPVRLDSFLRRGYLEVTLDGHRP